MRCTRSRLVQNQQTCCLQGALPADDHFMQRASILVWQEHSGCRPVCFGDYPQLLPSICLVAQQSKPMNHAVLVLCDIGWFQLAPVPDCMTGQETGKRLLRFLQRSQRLSATRQFGQYERLARGWQIHVKSALMEPRGRDHPYVYLARMTAIIYASVVLFSHEVEPTVSER